jgi:cytoskeletal protein CcmA (bactofilin family)
MPKTTIGKSLLLEGQLKGKEGLIIAGKIKGSVEVDGVLSVEKEAVIEADIKANNVKILGKVKGDISSTGNVHYMEDCSVTGNTITSRILIEDGATIKGSVHINI